MTFAAPVFLAGLALIPLLLAALALARRRPGRYAVRFPAVATLEAIGPGGGRVRRLLPTALLCLALAALALALARPEATVAVPVERASVVLVMDTSGSMEATDVEPSRLEAARAAALGFLDRVPDELQVGLVAYSDAPHTVLRPTQDRAPVRDALTALRADGGTATGDALTGALRALGERAEDAPPAAVVLLSDGATTTGRDPVDAARDARTAAVPIATVALGTAEGRIATPDGTTLAVPPDPETLRAIAEASGGRAYAAEDADALDEVYERLGSRIGTREEQREISAAFAAAGLVALGAALLAGRRWHGRLP